LEKPIALFKNPVYNTCMKRMRVVVILALLLVAMSIRVETTAAQGEAARYFPGDRALGEWGFLIGL
jgi:hypothetical protein